MRERSGFSHNPQSIACRSERSIVGSCPRYDGRCLLGREREARLVSAALSNDAHRCTGFLGAALCFDGKRAEAYWKKRVALSIGCELFVADEPCNAVVRPGRA